MGPLIRSVRRAPATLAAVVFLGCVDQAPTAPETVAVQPTLSMLQANGPELPRRHLVVLRNERAPSAAFLAQVQALGGRVDRRRDAIGVVTVSGLSDAGASALAAQAEVQGAGLDTLVQWISPLVAYGDPVALDAVAPDPRAAFDQRTAFFFAQRQWNIRQINADDAWLVTRGGQGATIAILDTGVDPDHIDLRGRVDLVKSRSVLTAGSSPCNAILGRPDEQTILDFNLHGSFVSGIAVSNGLGIGSVAPGATLIAVKVLNCTGNGSFDDVISGIEYASSFGADVINMSLGTVLPKSNPNIRPLVEAVQRAVLKAVARGSLVIAAVGNDGINLDTEDALAIPAQLLGVVSVSATAPFQQQNFDQITTYSNFGRLGVDVAAPGGDFLTGGTVLDLVFSVCSQYEVVFPTISCPGPNFFLAGAGTSFAAPHVAGLGAVIEGETKHNSFGLLLESCVLRGTDRPDGMVFSPLYGFGRINVLEAVQEFGCGRRLFS